MKNKKLIFVIFAALILAVPIYMAASAQDVLANGTFYKFRLQGRDPFDPMRGKYLRLNYDGLQIATNDKYKRGEKVFVTIGVDDEGYAFFDEVFKSEPKKGDYLETKIVSFYDYESRAISFGANDDSEQMKYSVRIDIPNNMKRYYINEELAKDGETLLIRERRSSYVGVKILNGDCRLQDVYVKGTPLKEYLKK